MSNVSTSIVKLSKGAREKLYKETQQLFDDAAMSADKARHLAAAALYNVEQFELYDFAKCGSMKEYFEQRGIPERSGRRYISQAALIAQATDLAEGEPITRQHVDAWCMYRQQLNAHGGDPIKLLSAAGEDEPAQEPNIEDPLTDELFKLMRKRFPQLPQAKKPLKSKPTVKEAREASIEMLREYLINAVTESASTYTSLSGLNRSEKARREATYLLLLIYYYVSVESKAKPGATLEFIDYDKAEEWMRRDPEELQLERPDVHQAIAEASQI